MPRRACCAGLALMPERALSFACGEARLYGILHTPTEPAPRGVLVVVGGPQYRVGSHRQFVLLARALAHAGIPVMRFDYRGMGDSEGAPRTFEDVNADIAAAIDEFVRQAPALREIVLWGLCDGAAAALAYAPADRRVAGLVLLNPWVRTDSGIARTYLQHYYLRRLLDPGFWRKLRSGQFSVGASLRSLAALIRASLGLRRGPAPDADGLPAPPAAAAREPLPTRLLRHLEDFRGAVLLILSGQDLTAEEFRRVATSSRAWRKALRATRVTRRDLVPADHTFSRREWRDQVAAWTCDWVKSLP